ncbi:hypothetical protein [Mesorhizobium sp.]|uniref:hypothetical protein n=2 Tax=Mesorhizobium sp. TaxID=1871066 RepID=UPI000FE2BBF3|nr:hypothetical protein [Mesorhizobium sp.]RWH67683.1 MAG: hypothetical protein EOQ84_28830 [Mesorhizobium sp.]RWK28862.1 MAG: hypothetical protein EOR40_28015 [Mesorhizobium sp.]RWL23459.1 MAG: hypothetical protein EOR58_26325 [Mesorhizobium sp.]RWL25253.1 MAG: hypothetical protein EOR63_28200 [Mesorhizobium sp.]RWL33595.1 MAG: hypothetical protein EOR59_25665 [Mesorhizobium sp.]
MQLVTVEVVEAQPPPISDLPTAQEEQHGENRAGGVRRLRIESDIDTYALGGILDVRWSGDNPGSERREGVARHLVVRTCARLPRH